MLICIKENNLLIIILIKIYIINECLLNYLNYNIDKVKLIYLYYYYELENYISKIILKIEKNTNNTQNL